jgi:peptidyl-tRNA hydrolase
LPISIGASFEIDRLAEKAEFKYKGRAIHLIKPTTFMNLSGKAIAYWLQELKIEKENLLVVVDDIALPFGSLRLRTKGSSAGHNVLKTSSSFLTANCIRVFVLVSAILSTRDNRVTMFLAILPNLNSNRSRHYNKSKRNDFVVLHDRRRTYHGPFQHLATAISPGLRSLQ